MPREVLHSATGTTVELPDVPAALAVGAPVVGAAAPLIPAVAVLNAAVGGWLAG